MKALPACDRIKEQMTLHPRRQLTIEQYFEHEERSEDRHEYSNGEIFVMSGGTLEHNTIVINLVSELRPALWGGKCRPYCQDVRLWVESFQLFTYPDLLIVCGPPELFPGRKDTLTNATLIIEVLSPSTRDYDAGDKFKFYRSLPSFQEYLLISQDEIRVQHHQRQASNRWLFTEFTDPKDTVEFSSITGVQLSLEAVYEGLNLP